MRRGDLLLALSVPMLLAAGLLPWQRDRICTTAGCGTVQAGAWSGSLAWTVPLLAGLALAGLWTLMVPARGRVPTAVAALTLAVAVPAAAVVAVSLEALVSGRTGLVSVDLPVVAEFPVLSVRPAEGLALGLLGLLLQAAAGWTALRHRSAPAPPPHPGTAPGPGPLQTGPLQTGPLQTGPLPGPAPTGPVPTGPAGGPLPTGPAPTGPLPGPLQTGPVPHRRRR